MNNGRFTDAMNFVFANEGGLSNHPSDRGGLTVKGITWKTYQKYCESIEVEATEENFRNMLDSFATDIYYKFYWQAHSLDMFPPALDIIVFDQVVNRGQRAIISFQKAANCICGGKEQISADGIVGPRTIAFLRTCSDLEIRAIRTYFIKECQIAYARIVQADPSQAAFITGWIMRTHKYL